MACGSLLAGGADGFAEGGPVGVLLLAGPLVAGGYAAGRGWCGRGAPRDGFGEETIQRAHGVAWLRARTSAAVIPLTVHSGAAWRATLRASS